MQQLLLNAVAIYLMQQLLINAAFLLNAVAIYLMQ